jgi:hypothetical protein
VPTLTPKEQTDRDARSTLITFVGLVVILLLVSLVVYACPHGIVP